jgi:hypothetical protein
MGIVDEAAVAAGGVGAQFGQERRFDGARTDPHHPLGVLRFGIEGLPQSRKPPKP